MNLYTYPIKPWLWRPYWVRSEISWVYPRRGIKVCNDVIKWLSREFFFFFFGLSQILRTASGGFCRIFHTLEVGSVILMASGKSTERHQIFGDRNLRLNVQLESESIPIITTGSKLSARMHVYRCRDRVAVFGEWWSDARRPCDAGPNIEIDGVYPGPCQSLRN